MILSSLRNRIFLTSALLAVLSIGAAIYLVSVRVTRELEESLQHEIHSTGQLVEQLRNTRAQMFAMSARLIADEPTLKAAVDTNDPATVQNNATIYQNQLNSNLLLVTNKTGDVLATVGASPRAAIVVATEPSVRRAIEGGESLSLIPEPDGLLHLVTVPIVIGISHPDILGTLSVGFLLDDAFARQLKQVTGSEIAAAIFGWDFIYYWNHRFMHESRFMWAIHVVHHSSERYNLSTALRQPVADALGTFVPYSLLSLLGVRPALIAQARGINLLYQYWIHTDSIRSLGPFEEVVNTPSHHRVHHAIEAEYLDRNYGGVLIIWDKMFGTFAAERDGAPRTYGLVRQVDTLNPVKIAFAEWAALIHDLRGARTWKARLHYMFGAPGWRPDGKGLTTHAIRAAAGVPQDTRVPLHLTETQPADSLRRSAT
jgi:sterol desaturase/sphingolipid hydroxylase (fatty acid hydroxylase superfamily)